MRERERLGVDAALKGLALAGMLVGAVILAAACIVSLFAAIWSYDGAVQVRLYEQALVLALLGLGAFYGWEELKRRWDPARRGGR